MLGSWSGTGGGDLVMLALRAGGITCPGLKEEGGGCGEFTI